MVPTTSFVSPDVATARHDKLDGTSNHGADSHGAPSHSPNATEQHVEASKCVPQFTNKSAACACVLSIVKRQLLDAASY